jgi:hypothetical protein
LGAPGGAATPQGLITCLFQAMPKFKPLPSYESLHQLLQVVKIDKTKYGVKSGLVWKVDRSGGIKAGTRAGYLRKLRKNRSDWYVGLYNFEYAVSRIIYFMSTNIDPNCYEIDHIDRNPHNNNFVNLRLATHNIQAHNRVFVRPNTSGVTGVYWNTEKQKWVAQLQNKRVNMYLGSFVCKLEAAIAYNNAVQLHIPEEYNKPLNDTKKVICDCLKCSKSSIIQRVLVA